MDDRIGCLIMLVDAMVGLTTPTPTPSLPFATKGLVAGTVDAVVLYSCGAGAFARYLGMTRCCWPPITAEVRRVVIFAVIEAECADERTGCGTAGRVCCGALVGVDKTGDGTIIGVDFLTMTCAIFPANPTLCC